MRGGQEPLISVIVPFYNIEECVDYCVRSLLNQNYDSYEIVLIDDGSEDGTGRRLESYRSNPHVRIFRKSNGGLSKARNYGVEHATGEYVTFVDGDDLVSPYYLSALVEGLGEAGVDLVIGEIKRIRSNEVDRSGFEKPITFVHPTKEELIARIMYEKTLPSGCAHLAPRSVYLEHPFPEGVYYEEIATIAAYVNAANACTLIEEPIYGYVMREGSIVHRRRASLKQAEDYKEALARFNELSADLVPQDSAQQRYFDLLHASRLFRLLEAVECVDESDRETVQRERREISIKARESLPLLKQDPCISVGNKIRFALLAHFPALYGRCFDLFDKVRG